jgi:hypothetical protein
MSDIVIEQAACPEHGSKTKKQGVVQLLCEMQPGQVMRNAVHTAQASYGNINAARRADGINKRLVYRGGDIYCVEAPE